MKSGEDNEKGKEMASSDAVASRRLAVYSCLDCMGKTIEEIMALTNLPLEEVRSQLLDLLLEDQILETVKGYYSLRL